MEKCAEVAAFDEQIQEVAYELERNHYGSRGAPGRGGEASGGVCSCGFALGKGARFCGGCGASIS